MICFIRFELNKSYANHIDFRTGRVVNTVLDWTSHVMSSANQWNTLPGRSCISSSKAIHQNERISDYSTFQSLLFLMINIFITHMEVYPMKDSVKVIMRLSSIS